MTQILDRYVTEHEIARKERLRGGPEWLAGLRHEALQRFLSLGFPTTRDEEWRFTSVTPIAERAFVLGSGVSRDSKEPDIAPFRMAGPVAAELVFVNGRYVPGLSSVGAVPAGTAIDGLAAVLAARAGDTEPYLARLARFDRSAFTALNTAFIDDGACVSVPAHVILEHPVHVLFVAGDDDSRQAAMSHPRVVIVLGDNSQASIVESYVGANDGRYLTNAVTEIVLGQNAVLDHYKVQRESVHGYHVGSMYVSTERSAHFTSHSLSLGGSLVRNEVMAVLDGEGGECTLNGLYLADDQRLVDNHTTIDHAKPHCGSREMYRGILADRARGVFNGKIVVRPDAQKTDAKQTNRALLLSEDAQINTKPQLEIFANDVKCTHGAAVGQLDDEAVFYLRSRGLGEPEARHLLVRAFAADVLNRMPLESLRGAVEEVLLRQLRHALPSAA
jgi:Fe-S cluster assembly protein SufD